MTLGAAVEARRLQYASGFGRKENTFTRTELKKKPVKRWQKCIEVRGDCVEKRLCTIVNKG